MFAEVEANTINVCNANGYLSPTLYYELEGTGDCLSASLTSSFDFPVLTIETGECWNATCYDQTNIYEQVISWRSDRDTIYRFAVTSSSWLVSGSFTFTVSVSHFSLFTL
jgi:hypothetical protein